MGVIYRFRCVITTPFHFSFVTWTLAGGSDYISTQQLQNDAFLTDCPPKEDRVEAATASFQMMSHAYQTDGELLQSQACMRPCPPGALCTLKL